MEMATTFVPNVILIHLRIMVALHKEETFVALSVRIKTVHWQVEREEVRWKPFHVHFVLKLVKLVDRLSFGRILAAMYSRAATTQPQPDASIRYGCPRRPRLLTLMLIPVPLAPQTEKP